MKKLIIYGIAFLTVFSTQTHNVNGQHPILSVVDRQNISFDLGNVVGIDQDKQGFIWLASNYGLHRYDGHNYISYYNDPEDSSSLVQNQLGSICISKSGIIWLGTWFKGLDRFDPKTQTFTHFEHNPEDSSSLSNNSINSILEDNEGKLWVGSSDGLNLFHPESGTFTRFQNISGDTTSLSHNEVRVIYQDRQNTIWVGTGFFGNNNLGPEEGGLNRYHPESNTFSQYKHNPENSNSLIDNKVFALLEDSRGNFWVGTKGNGLHTMNRETGKFIRHTYDPKHPNKISRAPNLPENDETGTVTFIHEDATGIIWIGTSGSGLSRYNPKTKKTVHYTNERGNLIGLKDNFLIRPFTSREGVFWMSTIFSNGNFYKTDPFIKVIEYSRKGAETTGILEDTAGNLWVSTKKGIQIYNSIHAEIRNTKLENQLPAQLKNTNQIIQDNEGNIWIGSVLGLWQKDAKTGKFTHFSHDPNNAKSISKGAVSSFFVDSKGLLWISTWRGDLYQWDPKTKSFVHFLKGIDRSESTASKSILSIGEDKSGNIWIGGAGMLGKRDKNSGSFKQHSNIIKKGFVSSSNFRLVTFDIMQDNNGVLWIGTDRGLYFYDDKSEDFIIFKDSVTGKHINSRVMGISQDKQQNIWVIATNGIQIELKTRIGWFI